MKSSYQSQTVSIDGLESPLVIAMVGLPARGKTYMSKKLTRYLNWIGYPTKCFNVGDYRRKVANQQNIECNADFFSPTNEIGSKLRESCALEATKDAITWLKDPLSGGVVAILDATNTTKERREMLYKLFVVEQNFSLFCVESICNDQSIIFKCVKEIKISNPDYVNSNVDKALQDFKSRLKNYEISYQPIDFDGTESHISFLKIIDQGNSHIINGLHGFIPSRIVHYLMNIHVFPRDIYITVSAETEYERKGIIGGDNYEFTEAGQIFKQMLTEFVPKQNIKNLCVWTSLLKRSFHTADQLDCPKVHWQALNDINSGKFDGMSLSDIRDNFHEEYDELMSNPYEYCFPRGESYKDLMYRLQPVIIELERQADVLLICHSSVARCLMAYFLDVPFDEVDKYDIPVNCVRKLIPVAYGCRMEDILLS